MFLGFFSPEYQDDTREIKPLVVTQPSPSVVRVESEILLPTGDDNDDGSTRLVPFRVVYAVMGNGDVGVTASFEFENYAPRMGLQFRMPKTFDQMRWLGLGPHECYLDRQKSGIVGLFAGTVEEQQHPYVVPQENANNMDVRWMALLDRTNRGLLAIGASGVLSASAWPYSQERLEAAEHINDLIPRDEFITVNLDLRQMGIGGGGCGMMPAEENMVEPGAYEYSFVLRAYHPRKGGIAALARELPPF
jgi:beta-galactosidase